MCLKTLKKYHTSTVVAIPILALEQKVVLEKLNLMVFSALPYTETETVPIT
jgi:hypothetical protein